MRADPDATDRTPESNIRTRPRSARATRPAPAMFIWLSSGAPQDISGGAISDTRLSDCDRGTYDPGQFSWRQ